MSRRERANAGEVGARRARRWIGLAVGTLAVALAAAWVAAHRQRLRYLALPVLTDPSAHAAVAGLPITVGPAAGARRLATLPSRVTAVAELDGVVFIGTFDAGVWRLDPARDRAPRPVGGLDGRERFVDALLVHDGGVVAATHRGAVRLGREGGRRDVLAPGEAVAALAVVDGALVLGTAHGLWRGGAPLDVVGPGGERLRVTALLATRDRLWIGTPDGVYAAARPLRAGAARWYPLVFGAPPASTDVVTALAPLGDGVLAGTDDGGLVRVDAGGVRALPLSAARANDVNPGALVAVGGGVVFGSEGAGLLRLAGAEARAVTRPADFPPARVSAVAAGARLLVGTAAGELWALDGRRLGAGAGSELAQERADRRAVARR